MKVIFKEKKSNNRLYFLSRLDFGPHPWDFPSGFCLWSPTYLITPRASQAFDSAKNSCFTENLVVFCSVASFSESFHCCAMWKVIKVRCLTSWQGWSSNFESLRTSRRDWCIQQFDFWLLKFIAACKDLGRIRESVDTGDHKYKCPVLHFEYRGSLSRGSIHVCCYLLCWNLNFAFSFSDSRANDTTLHIKEKGNQHLLSIYCFPNTVWVVDICDNLASFHGPERYRLVLEFRHISVFCWRPCSVYDAPLYTRLRKLLKHYHL